MVRVEDSRDTPTDQLTPTDKLTRMVLRTPCHPTATLATGLPSLSTLPLKGLKVPSL